MTTLNLETLAAGLDSETFGWQPAKEGIWVWRYYGQRLVREATYEEPAWYTEVESPYTLVKAEGYTVIICDEAGRELERVDYADFFASEDDYDEEIMSDCLAEAIERHNPWRDIAAEYEEGRWEQAISAWEDREGVWA